MTKRLVMFAILLVGPAFSETIVGISGSHSTYETGSANDWVAESWAQTGSYTGVTVKATVFQEAIGTPHGDGFAVLEEEVGSHAVQLDSTSFSFPADSSEASPDQITLFSNLTMGAGTYYLAMYGQGFWTGEFSGGDPTITNAGDVSNVTDTLVSLNGGHTFEDSNNGTFLDFRVTGAAVPVDDTPEPATALTLGGSLLLILLRKAGQGWHPAAHCLCPAKQLSCDQTGDKIAGVTTLT